MTTGKTSKTSAPLFCCSGIRTQTLDESLLSVRLSRLSIVPSCPAKPPSVNQTLTEAKRRETSTDQHSAAPTKLISASQEPPSLFRTNGLLSQAPPPAANQDTDWSALRQTRWMNFHVICDAEKESVKNISFFKYDPFPFR